MFKYTERNWTVMHSGNSETLVNAFFKLRASPEIECYQKCCVTPCSAISHEGAVRPLWIKSKTDRVSILYESENIWERGFALCQLISFFRDQGLSCHLSLPPPWRSTYCRSTQILPSIVSRKRCVNIMRIDFATRDANVNLFCILFYIDVQIIRLDSG